MDSSFTCCVYIVSIILKNAYSVSLLFVKKQYIFQLFIRFLINYMIGHYLISIIKPTYSCNNCAKFHKNTAKYQKPASYVTQCRAKKAFKRKFSKLWKWYLPDTTTQKDSVFSSCCWWGARSHTQHILLKLWFLALCSACLQQRTLNYTATNAILCYSSQKEKFA